MAGRKSVTAQLGLAALAAGGLVACSYIFDLPAQGQALTTDATAGSDGTGGTGDGAADDGPIITKPPPPPFCASQTAANLFCSDMDRTSAPTLTDLGAPALTGGGKILVVDSVSQSPPRSLLATVSGAGQRATIVHAVADGVATVGMTFGFDVLVSKWQTTSAAIGGLTVGLCSVDVVGVSAGWEVSQTCTVDGSPATVSSATGHRVDIGAWHRFVIGLRLSAPKTVTLDIDGERVVDVAALDAFGNGVPSASFGLEQIADGSAVVFEDNLLITSP